MADEAVPEGGMAGTRSTSFEAHLVRDTKGLEAVDVKLKSAFRALDRAEEIDDVEDAMNLVGYSGCYLDEAEVPGDGMGSPEPTADEEKEWWPEAVLGRRVKKGILYYKVKWRWHNLVTWEADQDVENRRAVDLFEALFRQRSEMPPTARRRFRPAFYVANRVAKPSRARLSSNPGARPESPRAPRITPVVHRQNSAGAVWSCEVEPNIWIPYDEDIQHTLEHAFLAGRGSVAFPVTGNVNATVHFDSMLQQTGTRRRVQRVPRRSDEDERRFLDQLSVDELRAYIASIVEFTPAHYEALSRLHEADKVRVTASREELDALPSLTFQTMLEQISNGVEFVGFDDECHICLEDYAPDSVLSLLPCGHAFHQRCIRDYFSKYSKLCPVCKARI